MIRLRRKRYEITIRCQCRRSGICPDFIIIGHSRGAILTSILLARGLHGQSKYLPKKAIFSGAAWPNPFDELLEAITPSIVQSSGLKSLYIVGDIDDVCVVV